jgi:hypothetical protein
MEKPIGDGLLPSPQMDTRGFYAAVQITGVSWDLVMLATPGQGLFLMDMDYLWPLGWVSKFLGSWCTIMACIASSFSFKPNLCY